MVDERMGKLPTILSSTRASSGFCSWDGAALAIGIDRGMRGWKAPTERDLGLLVDKLNTSRSVPWEPKGPALYWVHQAQQC